MRTRTIRSVLLATALAGVAPFLTPSTAEAALSNCVTRRVFAAYSGTTWMSQTVCNSGEIAVSAGGFCTSAGHMIGVSTTVSTADRLVWLHCSNNGNAYWYAMCCTP